MSRLFAGAQFRPVDRFTIAYLALTLPLLVFRANRPEALLLALLHVAGILALVAFRKSPRFRGTRVEVWFDFYPLPLFALFYSEIEILNRLLHNGRMFDPWIQAFEEKLFGGQPSRDLARQWPVPWLGEYLHLGYFSYYFLAPSLAFTLRFRRSFAAYHRAIACVALSFYISFLFFIAMPVAGPYYSFTPPDLSQVGYVLPRLVRWLLDRGSSVGAAFPSSHVAVSITVWIMAMRYHSKLSIVYGFLVPALSLGTIYGGYHYATDMLAGLLLGVLIGTIGHRWVASLIPEPARKNGRTAKAPVTAGRQ
ncbi:MAG TPA: phosphatase PAP2 family protein [Candidatus Eisenbacteria bacterium]|nr:phosphatase PAP2 family protein [Candidatus Eisenbacteria bacterium]